MRFYLLALLLLSSTLSSNATIFQPISIKKQISDSSGIVVGVVEVIESQLNENQKIITRVTIKPDSWIGEIESEDNEVYIYYPGGRIGDIIRKIEGAPKFKLGESVAVLTKEGDGYTWVSNLGLGKFSIKRIGEEKVLINQIFPSHPEIGQISLNKFMSLSKEIKNSKFSFRFKEKYEIDQRKERNTLTKSQSRSIASVNNESTNESSKLSPFWLVLFLGLLGLIVGVIRNRSL